MKKNILQFILLLLSLQMVSAIAVAKDKPGACYQVTVYHFVSPQQEIAIDNYLSKALLPALHRLRYAEIGVFKPIANDTASDKLIFVITPLKKAEQLFSLSTDLKKDHQFTTASQYFDTSYQNPPYTRMENIVLKAFSMAPSLTVPKLSGPRQDRVYELRSYESATEKYFRNKVEMFNEGGETAIFTRLNFNPVFYGEVVAGSRMPNLMYMTSFENKADRDAHWKSFSADEAWKKLSAMPHYQHNVSKSNIWFLRAAEYSDY